MTPTQFKEISQVSRKFAIPLMEHFDAKKLTMRIGDKRVLQEDRKGRGDTETRRGEKGQERDEGGCFLAMISQSPYLPKDYFGPEDPNFSRGK